MLPSFPVTEIEKSLVFSGESLVNVTTLWATPLIVLSASTPVLNLPWNVLLAFNTDCILSLACVAFSPSPNVPETWILLFAFDIVNVAGFFKPVPVKVQASFVLFAVINAVLAMC